MKLSVAVNDLIKRRYVFNINIKSDSIEVQEYETQINLLISF